MKKLRKEIAQLSSHGVLFFHNRSLALSLDSLPTPTPNYGPEVFVGCYGGGLLISKGTDHVSGVTYLYRSGHLIVDGVSRMSEMTETGASEVLGESEREAEGPK